MVQIRSIKISYISGGVASPIFPGDGGRDILQLARGTYLKLQGGETYFNLQRQETSPILTILTQSLLFSKNIISEAYSLSHLR